MYLIKFKDCQNTSGEQIYRQLDQQQDDSAYMAEPMYQLILTVKKPIQKKEFDQ
ncbi:unnamed protein product [Paramecium sonneborni]|uniref:Uncharacterized protein n=1 Tax=Paramecium sonneborni TaxID=65129 RepID=A0A8S1R4C7_9CILI|nr:unnamed protein product [Paramecium sonneborni]